MFILLIYGLVHRNNFIIISSIIGCLLYFIVLPSILTNGGSIRELAFKKEWVTIQNEQGNYAEHLTLLKTTFAHENKMTAQLNYYGFALSFYDELQVAIQDEKAREHTNKYNVSVHNTIKERISFYEMLFEQYETMTLPKDVFYEELHKTFKHVLFDLQQINAHQEKLQVFLQHFSLTEEEKQAYLAQHTKKHVSQLETLYKHQQQLDEQMQQLTKHLESTISHKLND